MRTLLQSSTAAIMLALRLMAGADNHRRAPSFPAKNPKTRRPAGASSSIRLETKSLPRGTTSTLRKVMRARNAGARV